MRSAGRRCRVGPSRLAAVMLSERAQAHRIKRREASRALQQDRTPRRPDSGCGLRPVREMAQRIHASGAITLGRGARLVPHDLRDGSGWRPGYVIDQASSDCRSSVPTWNAGELLAYTRTLSRPTDCSFPLTGAVNPRRHIVKPVFNVSSIETGPRGNTEIVRVTKPCLRTIRVRLTLLFGAFRGTIHQ